MTKKLVGILFAGSIGTACGSEEQPAAMEKYVSPAPTVKALGIKSLDVTADGRYAAFARDGTLFLVETTTAGTSRISARLDDVSDTRPYSAWSADGTMLAYFKSGSGDNFPIIVDRASTKTVFEAERPICLSGCEQWIPAWTQDGRLLYVADPATEKAKVAVSRGSQAQSPIAEQRYGRVRVPGGVVVLQSNRAKEDFGRREQTFSDDAQGPCQGGCQPTEIIAIDPRSRRSTTLARGAAFKGVFIAPTGEFAVAIVRVPPLPSQRIGRYYSYYRLPLTKTRAGARTPPAPGPTDAAGNLLVLLAANVSHFQIGGASISHTGKYLAYTTTGPSATGDVQLVDIASGRQKNLTEHVTLPPNPFDADPRKDITGVPLADHAGKFGSDFLAPIWSNDEHAVLAVRPVNDQGTLRYQLWRVPIAGGRPEPIGMGAFSLEALAQCEGGRRSCKYGPEKAILAALRMRQADGSDRLVVGAIDETNGKVRVIRDVGAIDVGIDYLAPSYDHSGAASGEFVISQDGMRAVGLLKPSDAAPELWSLSIDGQGTESVKSLNLLQTEAIPKIKVRRVEFDSPNKERLGVRIELPADHREGERLPAVMVVYGGARASLNPVFNGGAQWYSPLRDARYALLLPDLPPVPTPNGKNCDYMAANTVAALDAAVETGSIDPQRVGVTGISWGGYSTFCITTRTDRFKAAVAAVPLSNLFSMGVEGTGKRGGFRFLASFVGAPWESPDWYVNESPGFRLDKLVTPMMIVYGVKDFIEPNHSNEIFQGLSELKRSAQLVGYQDSDHGAMFDYQDYWQRTFEWFDLYLRVTQDEKSARPLAR